MTGSPETPFDVLLMQTAAALENLAVESYTSAAALPCVVNGSAHLRDLLAGNRDHHLAHAAALNQAIVTAGGAEQHAADARYAGIVGRRLAAMTDPASLADLLADLEGIGAQTCTRFAGLAGSGSVRSLLVKVASVDAQHGSELLILRTLTGGGHAEPGATGAAARAIPAAVGTVGIPHAAYPTADASAIDEGRVP
jgi:hypothetical protein